MTATSQKKTLQDVQMGTERGQTKLGKTHVDYWYDKVRKRNFLGRDGLQVEIPDWQVRIKHLGKEVRFNLKTANRAEAAVQAKDIYIYLMANGWDLTLAKYKPQTEKREDLTVLEFTEIYRGQIEQVEYPPLKRTYERYITSLLFICTFLGIKRIAQLSSDKVKKFTRRYLERGLKLGRAESSIKTSCNSHLRAGASLYSKEMMDGYERAGINLVNPFSGKRFRRIEIEAYTPMRHELLDSIWRDSIKLRDGDPKAPPPLPVSKGGRPKANSPKRAKKKSTRWKEPDWRKPHPEAFSLLLQELGLGFRRAEADMSEWSWFFIDQDGRRLVEIKKTEFFTPKGKRKRILSVEPAIWDELHATYHEGARFVVSGKVPKIYTKKTAPKHMVYRCDRHHRTLAAWLRKRGIDDMNPCHRLRKEFGSYVATSFGLFVCQRMLGHSSPKVTDDFYAALVSLPELRHAHIPIKSEGANGNAKSETPESMDLIGQKAPSAFAGTLLV